MAAARGRHNIHEEGGGDVMVGVAIAGEDHDHDGGEGSGVEDDDL